MAGDRFVHRQPDAGDLGPVNPHARFSLFEFSSQPVALQYFGKISETKLTDIYWDLAVKWLVTLWRKTGDPTYAIRDAIIRFPTPDPVASPKGTIPDESTPTRFDNQ